MDLSQLMGPGGPLSFLQGAPQPGQPTSAAPGAPMNILPPAAQTAPMGILNGASPPQQGQGQGNQQLLQQAQKLISTQQQQLPQMQPIQMARPMGSQGIDPMKLLAAMQQNKLMSA